MSVQGVVVVVGGSLAPSTYGSPPHDDGKCLGALRSGGMVSGSFSSHAQLMPLVSGSGNQQWGRMVFPVPPH